LLEKSIHRTGIIGTIEMRILFLTVIFFIASCASLPSYEVGVVKLHDDFIELNGKRFNTTYELANKAAKYSELHIKVHPCVNTSVIIEVVEKVKEQREGVIHIGSLGSHDDGTCH